MKKLFLLLAIASSFTLLNAQNNLVVFSEQGEQFFVAINGVKQNAKPETNVKVTGLMQPMVTTKIIFADGKTADLDQKIYLMSGGNEVSGYEFVYALKMKKGTSAAGSGDAMEEGGLIGVANNLKKVDKGYKLAFRSEAVIAQSPPIQGQTVVVYSTVPPTEVTTTTISTTTTNSAPSGSNGNVGMNANGVNFNMNVNVNEGSMNSSTSTMTSTTTTSSTTTSSGAGSGNVYVLDGYSGANNCPWPMSPNDFASAKNSIKSKSFEDSKFTMAKQILNSNCMLSSQVKEVMMLFDFENTKLDFAKFAWGKTFDPGNYYKLNDAFQFESSIDDLNKYIDSRR